jgi:geranylgeranyl reductase family protein
VDDVIVVGAGPAGAVAAIVLARAGARVRLIDRARFPRDKLCGDTLNPGTMAVLQRLGLSREAETEGLAIHGMRITGERRVSVEALYPHGLCGRAISRRRFDQALVERAIDAGVRFEPGLAVRRLVTSGDRVTGVVVSTGVAECHLPAEITIAADGRHSTIAFALGLARHPRTPRRYAVGVHVEHPTGAARVAEMHIRSGRYIGVAPLPGNVANVCLVKSWSPEERRTSSLQNALRDELAHDFALRDRFADARFIAPPVVLGPLAVDATDVAAPDGLLLAGDAGGFVDPMTGDGLRFAVRGGELAADAALTALAHGWSGVRDRHEHGRAIEFTSKWRFNRTLRAVVGSAAAVWVASACAPLAPGIVRALVARAGDCALTPAYDGVSARDLKLQI